MIIYVDIDGTICKEEGDVISQERADQLFDMDFDDHSNAAKQIPGFFKATKKQQAGLIDLTFNMGPNWYKGFPSFQKHLLLEIMKKQQDK